jgi:sulfocyanin
MQRTLGLIALVTMLVGCNGNYTRATSNAAMRPAAAPFATIAHRPPTIAADVADTGQTPGTVRVNQFMSYDTATKTVELQVIAAFDHSLGGFNFNGGFSGNQTITVPKDWMVRMHVVNKDAIPHSALIIAATTPIPALPDKAAIPRAYTTHLTDGLAPGDGSDDVPFKASPVGSYFLACGVPGHAASGMYIRFNVSDTASVPAYTM